jgi:hypothetical protein
VARSDDPEVAVLGVVDRVLLVPADQHLRRATHRAALAPASAELGVVRHGAIVGHGQDDATTLVVVESDWLQASVPGFLVEFAYPAVTPQGHAAKREEVERAGAHGVHVTSPGSGELYVELVRHDGITPADEYARHRPYLEQRFGEGAVTELTETRFDDRPASRYAFRWEEGERAVLLLQLGDDTYRVIHDPRSALNARVLATLSVRTEG